MKPVSKEQDQPLLLTRQEMIAAAKLGEFVDLVGSGGAVPGSSIAQMLPRAQSIAFIERGGSIVAAAALKRAEPSYAKELSGRSGFQLAGDIPELGYVVVSPACRGQHLSTKVVRRILVDFGTRTLFATTSDRKMKRVLAKNGFRRVGKKWSSRRPNEHLSLWIRKGDKSR